MNYFSTKQFTALGARIIFGIIFALGFIVAAPAAHAADLTVTPAVIDDHGLPQDIFNYTLTLTNTTDHQINIFAYVYTITADGSQPFIDPSLANRPASLANWITVTRGALTFAPGETKKIPVGVTINPYATAGEYHAAIAFEEGGIRDDADAHFAGSPQTLLDFTVASNKKEELSLVALTPDKRFYSGFPASISYVIKNNGDVPSTPGGAVLFYDHIGHEIGSVPANPDGVTIAPGESHTFTATWTGANAGMGQFQAALQMDYGPNNAQLADTVMFWILPWQKILLAFIALLAIAIAFAIIAHRSYLRSHHRRMKFFEYLVNQMKRNNKAVLDLRAPHLAEPPKPPRNYKR